MKMRTLVSPESLKIKIFSGTIELPWKTSMFPRWTNIAAVHTRACGAFSAAEMNVQLLRNSGYEDS